MLSEITPKIPPPMHAETEYRWLELGEWRLVVHPGAWNDELQKRVTALVNQQPWAKHPQTLSVPSSMGGSNLDLFLKIFHPIKGSAAWKNWFRCSKALQAWRQGVALSEAGFNVPLTVAAGEQRRFGGFRRGFIVSQKVEGKGVPAFLRDLAEHGLSIEELRAKRAGLRQLAATIRRFHESGFVHGDLVATNVFVNRRDEHNLIFVFMDNDRTRRYPRWFPQSLWKRNLIQLNRLPLPGITLQDRMRFFCVYLQHKGFTASDRRLALWFERKTRQRRKECDGISPAGDFRRIMRWSNNLPSAKKSLERAG